jgi:AsmA protein
VKGTIGTNRVDTRLELREVRRVDFMPRQTLNADITCAAIASGIFHRLDDIHCAWPPEAQRASAAVTVTGPGAVVTGAIPQVLEPKTVQMDATADDVPLSTLLDALRATSPRIAPELAVSGDLSLKASCCGEGELSGLTFSMIKTKLALGAGSPFVDGDISGQSIDGKIFGGPVALDLGAPTPAVLDVRADWNGYTMHLTGNALPSRLRSLASALPQFGDGLAAILPEAGSEPEQPIRLDATATRSWFGPQTWTAAAVALPKTRAKRHRQPT